VCVFIFIVIFMSGAYKFQVPGCLGDYILYHGTWYLWVFRVQLVSRYFSATKNFEVVPRFFKNMCIVCVNVLDGNRIVVLCI
jgi:hypothetical protein